MARKEQLSAGLFAGTDKLVRSFFELREEEHLGQIRVCWKIVARPRPAADLIDLVGRLYRVVAANLPERPWRLCGRRRRPDENWRWTRQTIAADLTRNLSKEVVLERAVAMLAAQGHLREWCNQIPVASGLVKERSGVVDLARIAGDRLDLYELKWASNTPLSAVFQVLNYGLAYLLCRSNRTKFNYADLDTMKVQALGLNVLAPVDYYKRTLCQPGMGDPDLTWLQTGLDAGLRAVSDRLLEPALRTSFQMLALPLESGMLFANGAEALEACNATSLPPKAMALVRAMSDLAPVYPARGVA